MSATDILIQLVQQANSQRFQGNVEVEGDFIKSYRMPCGPVHAAIAYLQGRGITVDDFGVVSRPPIDETPKAEVAARLVFESIDSDLGWDEIDDEERDYYLSRGVVIAAQMERD